MKVRLANFEDSPQLGVKVKGPGWKGRMTYEVDMNRRVGYFGGTDGAAVGNPPLSRMRIVVESDGVSVASAYPIQ
jgi:hypothetical protein